MAKAPLVRCALILTLTQTPHAELIFHDKYEIIYISSFSEEHFSLYLTKEKVNGTDFWQDCSIYLFPSPGLLTLSMEEFQFLFLEGVTMKTSNETFYYITTVKKKKLSFCAKTGCLHMWKVSAVYQLGSLMSLSSWKKKTFLSKWNCPTLTHSHCHIWAI